MYKFTFHTMQDGTSGEPQCASWDFDLKRMHLVLSLSAAYKLIVIILFNHLIHYAEWRTEGCVTAEKDGSVVTCNCNHLTNFAILVVSVKMCCI